MDTLYILTIIAGIALFLLAIVFINKKYNVKTNDILQGINIIENVTILIKATLLDMKVDKEKIQQYCDLIIYALEMIKSLDSQKSKEEKIAYGFELIEVIAKIRDIVIEEEQKQIIKTALTLAFNMLDAFEKQINK